MLNLKPSEIFYSQESIKNIFTGRHIHCGKRIGDTLDELADGRTTVKQISRISVKDINGKWITADNRRLWVFKHFELLGGCTCIPAIQTNHIDRRKLNSPNGGIRIRVKGHPGGKWYDKLITNPAQYQNCLRGLFSDPYSKTAFSISNPLSYCQTDNNEECVSTRQDIDTTPPFGCQPKSVFGYHEQSDVNRTAFSIGQTLYRRSTSTPYAPLIGGQRSAGTAENVDETFQAASLNQSFRTFGLNSTVPSSHSTHISAGTSLRSYSEQVEGLVPYTTQSGSERPTCSYENKTGNKVNLHQTLSLANHVQYQERTKDADLHSSFYTVGSPLPGTRTISFEGLAQKVGTKVKWASRQAFTQLINVKQPKVNPKIPVMMMLDPSEIRYTEDTIEYPLSDKRWPKVQRRLLDLHDAENHKPLEVYRAYDIYWVKEENDILWSLKDNPDWRKIKHKLKVLVTEDNDAFLEFMRKEKPWLQISDILQIGQKIEFIK